MRTTTLKFVIATAIALVASNTSLAAKKCSGKVAVKGTGWRAQNTHLTVNNELNATNATREKKMEQTAKNMVAFILEDKDVPEMEFFAEAAVKVKVIRHWKDNAIPSIQVGGAGKLGSLARLDSLARFRPCGHRKRKEVGEDRYVPAFLAAAIGRAH